MTYKRHAAGRRGRQQEPLYDTNIPTPTHGERALTLVTGIATGTLSTIAVEPAGHPYGSFVTFALDNAAPVFLISALAEHTKNLLGDGRCSLLIAEPGDGDPLARGRVTLVGHGKRLAKGKASESARSSYLEVHPNASYYVDFKDFHFWRMQVESIRYIGGYGRMSWVPADEWNTATADPIAGAERRIIDHMNADHADTMALYCQAFSQAKNAEHVRLSSVDRYGFEMSVKTEHGPRPVRLAFESEVVNAHDVRKEMVAMAKKARATLGK